MGAREKLADSTFSSLEVMMAAYADEAIRVAWADHRCRFDFGEPSVQGLEQILDGQSTEDLEFQTRLWGAYLGEVLRRRFGGEWELSHYPGDGNTRMPSQAPTLVPAVVIRGSRLYPLIKVYRRLTLGPAENVTAFYTLVAERLNGPLDRPSPVQ